MSFDLAVWFESERVPVAVAAEKYERLCDGDRAGFVAVPAVEEFCRALTAEFPDPTGDRGTVKASPWTAGLDVSPAHVIMPIAGSRVDDVAPRVLDLASRHGLVCFDPQALVLHVPPALRGPHPLTLSWCRGLPIVDPQPRDIEHAVNRLSADNWFVVLETEDGARFVQAGLGMPAGVRPGQFALEHRDGGPDRHERTVVSDPQVVTAALVGFASGDLTWKRRLQWEKVVL